MPPTSNQPERIKRKAATVYQAPLPNRFINSKLIQQQTHDQYLEEIPSLESQIASLVTTLADAEQDLANKLLQEDVKQEDTNDLSEPRLSTDHHLYEMYDAMDLVGGWTSELGSKGVAAYTNSITSLKHRVDCLKLALSEKRDRLGMLREFLKQGAAEKNSTSKSKDKRRLRALDPAPGMIPVKTKTHVEDDSLVETGQASSANQSLLISMPSSSTLLQSHIEDREDSPMSTSLPSHMDTIDPNLFHIPTAASHPKRGVPVKRTVPFKRTTDPELVNLPIGASHPESGVLVKRSIDPDIWVLLECPICKGNGRWNGLQWRWFMGPKGMQEHLRKIHKMEPEMMREERQRLHSGYEWLYGLAVKNEDFDTSKVKSIKKRAFVGSIRSG